MSHHTVTHSLILDALPIAQDVEASLGPYLIGLPEEAVAQAVLLQLEFARAFPNRRPPQMAPELGLRAVEVAANWVLSQLPAARLLSKPRLTPAQVKRACLYDHVELGVYLRHLVQVEWRDDEDVMVRLAETLHPITSYVSAFVGRDEWCLYSLERRGVDVVVEKGIDYRILDWERRLEARDWS